MAKSKKVNKDDSGQILRALPYLLWPIAIILIVIEETKDKKDKVLRHHAYNAVGFAIGVLILSIPITLVAVIPIFGDALAALYLIAVIILALVFALRAYRGEKVVVPFTTEFMRKNIKGF